MGAEHLGFEPVDTYDFWATGFEGGPLQISADGGRTCGPTITSSTATTTTGSEPNW